MKKLFLRVLCAIGLHRFAAWWNRNRVVILCYHGVTENSNRYAKNVVGQDVQREAFAAHLDYLQKHYRIISLDQYLRACVEREALQPYSVVVTFDDGYRNIATVAAPLLHERAIPYTVFIITDAVSASEEALRAEVQAESDDASFLSWTEAREMAQSGLVKFESHTCTHPDLLSISAEQAARELLSSRDAIKTEFGTESSVLAYPYGHFSEAVAAQAKACGYLSAVTIDDGPNDTGSELHTLRRIVISNQDRDALFAARVSCLTWWLSLLRIRLLRTARALLQRRPSVIEAGMRLGRGKVRSSEDAMSG